MVLTKKKTAILLVIMCVCLIFSGCFDNTISAEDYDIIRIHIRAESNGAADQGVKLKVRDAVNNFLAARLEGIYDRDRAYAIIGQCQSELKRISDGVLKANGFGYSSTVKLSNEYFPSRIYEGIIVESGSYDALVINLGTGKGDNWWCVIYPPLCYLKPTGEGDIRYKSYILEFFKKYF